MKFLISIIFCVATVSSFTQNQVSANSNITDVTVFIEGAQVTRTGNISLKAGENLITFSNLAGDINPTSINIEGNENYLIKSVNHSRETSETGSGSFRIEEIKSQIDELDFTISTRKSLERVYMEEKSLLLSNKVIKGENETLLAEDLKEMSTFFRSHLEELEYKLLELKLDIKKLSAEKEELQQELYRSVNNLNAQVTVISVMLISDKNINTNISLSYIISNAGWYATYDVRTKDVNQPVDLIYKANVSQTTGIDWNDVNLTLSTGSPIINGAKPVLSPWYLNVYNAKQNYAWYNSNVMKSESRRRKDKSEPQGNYDVAMEEDVLGFSNISLNTQKVEGLISEEFRISVPFTIPSDGENYEVEIQRNSLASEYEYYTAPVKEKEAFLLSRLTSWSELNLLPGEASVFFQGSYVGSSFLDPYSTKDTLDISLGKDKNIVVQREKIEDFCKTSTFGGKKTTTRAHRIIVKNNKSSRVDIKVEDQIPLTKTNDVSVQVENLSGGELNETTGIVSWPLTLAPGESKEIILQFTVKHPKKLNFARL